MTFWLRLHQSCWRLSSEVKDLLLQLITQSILAETAWQFSLVENTSLMIIWYNSHVSISLLQANHMQHCFNGVLMAELMNVDLVLVEKAALGWKELSLVFFGVGVDWCCLPEFDDLARWPMSGTVVRNIRKSLKVNEVRIWRWLWDQFELASAKAVVFRVWRALHPLLVQNKDFWH